MADELVELVMSLLRGQPSETYEREEAEHIAAGLRANPDVVLRGLGLQPLSLGWDSEGIEGEVWHYPENERPE